MNRRDFLRVSVGGLGVAWAASQARAEPAAANRPRDVLFLILEDVSPVRFGCYGNTICKTPNIDRLAAGGVRFLNAHTTPPCSPSRTAMLSGVRPENSRCFDNGQDEQCRRVFAAGTSLPLNFKRHGYQTVRIGKIGHPDDAGWWTEQPDVGRADKTARPPRGPGTEPGAKAIGSGFEYGPSGLDDLEEGDGQKATAAIAALQAPRDKPLFLAVGFHADHLPFRAPDKYFAMYPPGQMPIPKNPGSGPDLLPTEETWSKLRAQFQFGVTGPNNPHTIEQWREAIAAHYACLTYADAQIGRILDALETSGRADNTIVVLWSDHGFELGENWSWRKGGLRDMSTKSALIVRAPGVTRPAVCHRVVECMDVHPTLLELCGLPVPPTVEAVSMVPVLADSERPWKKAALIYREKGETVGVSTERYRLNVGKETLELFDHATDPLEFENVASDPARADVVKDLRALAEAGWRRCLPEGARL